MGILNKASTTQGAALLASKDPATAMDEHEASMRAHQGGIVGNGDLAAQEAMVTKNTELMTRFGFNGIPTIVGAVLAIRVWGWLARRRRPLGDMPRMAVGAVMGAIAGGILAAAAAAAGAGEAPL